MRRTTARWTTTTLAVAALMMLPGSGFAQTQPPAQPPAETQPPAAAQPPATTQPPADQQSPQIGSSAQEAAKVHLTAARNSLSQLTQLPAAVQLQGEARAQISQLISNFNELITTQSDWKASYGKVQANLSALLAGSAASAAAAGDPARATGTAGAVGTSGTTDIDPAIRAKLMEFRSHLERFEDVAGATGETARTDPASPSATTAEPTTAQPNPNTPPDSEPASANDAQELLRHVDAIEAILGAQSAAQAAAQSTAGTTSTTPGAPRTTTSPDMTLTQAQLEQLRTHLSELRKLIEK
jgi:hypothetical protein